MDRTTDNASEAPREKVGEVHRSDSRRVFATLVRGDLAGYHLAHAARADLCRRSGGTAEARASYERALDLAEQEPERRYLRRRLADLAG